MGYYLDTFYDSKASTTSTSSTSTKNSNKNNSTDNTTWDTPKTTTATTNKNATPSKGLTCPVCNNFFAHYDERMIDRHVEDCLSQGLLLEEMRQANRASNSNNSSNTSSIPPSSSLFTNTNDKLPTFVSASGIDPWTLSSIPMRTTATTTTSASTSGSVGLMFPSGNNTTTTSTTNNNNNNSTSTTTPPPINQYDTMFKFTTSRADGFKPVNTNNPNNNNNTTPTLAKSNSNSNNSNSNSTNSNKTRTIVTSADDDEDEEELDSDEEEEIDDETCICGEPLDEDGVCSACEREDDMGFTLDSTAKAPVKRGTGVVLNQTLCPYERCMQRIATEDFPNHVTNYHRYEKVQKYKCPLYPCAVGE